MTEPKVEVSAFTVVPLVFTSGTCRWIPVELLLTLGSGGDVEAGKVVCRGRLATACLSYQCHRDGVVGCFPSFTPLNCEARPSFPGLGERQTSITMLTSAFRGMFNEVTWSEAIGVE